MLQVLVVAEVVVTGAEAAVVAEDHPAVVVAVKIDVDFNLSYFNPFL